jgi:hypothetical protein
LVPNGLTAPEFRSLVALDMDAVADDEVAQISRLGGLWLADAPTNLTIRNQPIRASRWLNVEIGDGTFAAARAAWERL